MNKKILSLVFTALLLGGTVALYAQGAPPSPPPPPPPPPPNTPIDGGVLFLLASGLAYGVKKLYNKQA